MLLSVKRGHVQLNLGLDKLLITAPITAAIIQRDMLKCTVKHRSDNLKPLHLVRRTIKYIQHRDTRSPPSCCIQMEGSFSVGAERRCSSPENRRLLRGLWERPQGDTVKRMALPSR